MRRAAAALVALVAITGLSACSYFGGESEDEMTPLEEDGSQGPPIPYDVTFTGTVDAELLAALESASASRRDTERPPTSEFLLQRRAETDLANLESALRSLGYYEGTVSQSIRYRRPPPEAPENLVQRQIVDRIEGPAAEIVFNVEPGPRYKFAELEIVLQDPQNGFSLPTAESLGLRRGEPATAQRVLDAQRDLVLNAGRAGCPFARPGELDAVIDRDERTMDVTLQVTTGPRAVFGEPAFTGGEGIADAFLRNRMTFEPGETYDPVKVNDARQGLINTNLFSTVVVNQGEELGADGRLPITFELTQRAARSIGGGVGYQTDEGPNATVFWEHRNIFGAGERLRLDLYGSPLRQQATANLRKPDVPDRSTALLVDGSVKREDTEAYYSESIGAGIGFERRFTREITGSLGLAYRFGRTEERDRPEEEFGLLSVPSKLNWDFSDNLLNPTRGGRLFLTATPYLDTINSGVTFFKTQVTTTRYIPFGEGPRVVLALRGSVGSIAGAQQNEVPADERFYAGGGGSVRGFGFQLAGPLDDKDDPTGGRSLFEASGELRTRITESIGIVTFLDAGTVFEATVPDFSEELRYGTGLGLRYITPIGPVRFDVGFPINPRSGVDDLYQIYISIGQAF